MNKHGDIFNHTAAGAIAIQLRFHARGEHRSRAPLLQVPAATMGAQGTAARDPGGDKWKDHS
jgi:hypothetical protein